MGASPCPRCGTATAPETRRKCDFHSHHQLGAGNCTVCNQPLVADYQRLVQDWTPIAKIAGPAAVPDATVNVDEETTTTTVEVLTSPGGVRVSIATSMTPQAATPVPVPATAPTTTTPVPDGATRVWDVVSGAATIRVTSTQTVTRLVAMGHETVTTVVKTKVEGAVTTPQAVLFAAVGNVNVYPVKDLPQAETV